MLKLNKIEGKWIIQSTYYSLLNNQLKTDIDNISWNKIKKSNQQIPKSIIKLIEKNIISTHMIYTKKSKKNTHSLYKLFLYYDQNHQGEVFHFDHLGKILSKSKFTNRPDNSLCFFSQNNTIDVTEIIYFTKNNLKTSKTVITKNKQCIGISFSSEIKII